ncbi:hypothetical protein ATANTOWER_010880 [Ataeniobius toweri]|uniref:Uncharacterized protein n=1 Tax=Ataeniobius toweri TaxID=208326 RepID=A0ABU7AGL3_9TELE|nr:hypothetical protein [Ataeniobius toweri]
MAAYYRGVGHCTTEPNLTTPTCSGFGGCVENTMSVRRKSLESSFDFIRLCAGGSLGVLQVCLTFKDGKSTENRTLHLNVEGNSLVRIGVIVAVFCVVSVCLIASTVIYTLRKKQLKKEDGDPDDLTYAVVTTVPQPNRRLVKEKVEEEVEYGHIKSAG